MSDKIPHTRTLGNYGFIFEPPLDTRTEGLDLVDAVVLQMYLNGVGVDKDDMCFKNIYVLNVRERDEAQVGSMLFHLIDHPRDEDLLTHDRPLTRDAMGRFLEFITGRSVTVEYLYELPIVE